MELPKNIQSYLIVQFGPSTAWPTASATSSASSASTTASSSELLPVIASATTSPTSSPDSPPASSSGLTQGQKIGIGIGVPLGILALAAILIPCCFACRKKKNEKNKREKNKREISGYEPPPSPGFMPRGAFQEKSTNHQQEYHTPLRHTSTRNQSWDHDDDPWISRKPQDRMQNYAPATSMGNTTTVMGPPLVHTHSSSRARGQRTSHSSLHSVTEVREPDDQRAAYASQERALRRSSIPLHTQDIPPIPTSFSTRRKSIPQAESSVLTPTSDHASGHFSLLRSAVLQQDRSSSNSSHHVPTMSSPEVSRRSSEITDSTSPTSSSPNYMNQHFSSNPFSNDHTYVESYGPEYQGGYVDVDDGLYGGHRSLSAYPPPEKRERRGSKGMTEWPLKGVEWPLRSLGSRRLKDKNPEWDPVYE